MNYLALGDSISIDTYTGKADGGAASQFARLIEATEFQNLTRDGRMTAGVLEAWDEVLITPNVVTLTAGGNDFLQGAWATFNGQGDWSAVSGQTLANLEELATRLAAFGCPVIVSTIYDPTDGDDSRLTSLGMAPAIAGQARTAFNAINNGIRKLAARRGFQTCDLEKLFHGHTEASAEPWIISHIEPNLAGATAIASEWHRLLQE